MKLLLVALVLVSALVGAGVALAQSGSAAPATSNLSVGDGVNPGEVVVAWDHVPQATHYRIGYVNMQTDYPLAISSVTGDWINAFIYVDENAQNVAVSNGRAEYTVRRLEQDVRHAFTVLTSSNFVDTGGGGSVISTFAWPPIGARWEFHTVADRGGATTPAPGFDFVSMYPNCDAVRAHYPGGVQRGSPIYRSALDRDGDGVACEPTSVGPTGDYLPIRAIGTFTGTGDNADNVISLVAGVYRVTASRQSTDGNFFVEVVELSTGDERFVGIYGRGETGGSQILTIYDDESDFRLQHGSYILQVDTDNDWEIRIDLLMAH